MRSKEKRWILQEGTDGPFTLGSSGDYGGDSYLVVGVEVEEADVGGAAAGGADGHGVDADDLADFAGGFTLMMPLPPCLK